MKDKEKNFVSAVVYVRNAEDRIEKFLSTVCAVLEENFEHSEIICVNDCSIDESVNVIKETCKKFNAVSVSVINMSYFHGLEVAMNAGLDIAIGDYVFEFDTTVLDFDESEIMNIYERCLEGYDLVSASPDKKQKHSSRLFYWVYNQFTDVSCKMRTESFRVMSRRMINRVGNMNKTIPYRKAVYSNCGLKTDNIIYHVVAGKKTDRRTQKEENKYRKGLATDVLILFTQVGYKFSILMTLVMILVSVAVGIYTVITYIMLKPVQGWTTTILFLSIAFFGLFGIMTIVIKYLQIIVDLIFKRNKYSYESIEKM